MTDLFVNKYFDTTGTTNHSIQAGFMMALLDVGRQSLNLDLDPSNPDLISGRDIERNLTVIKVEKKYEGSKSFALGRSLGKLVGSFEMLELSLDADNRWSKSDVSKRETWVAEAIDELSSIDCAELSEFIENVQTWVGDDFASGVVPGFEFEPRIFNAFNEQVKWLDGVPSFVVEIYDRGDGVHDWGVYEAGSKEQVTAGVALKIKYGLTPILERVLPSGLNSVSLELDITKANYSAVRAIQNELEQLVEPFQVNGEWVSVEFTFKRLTHAVTLAEYRLRAIFEEAQEYCPEIAALPQLASGVGMTGKSAGEIFDALQDVSEVVAEAVADIPAHSLIHPQHKSLLSLDERISHWDARRVAQYKHNSGFDTLLPIWGYKDGAGLEDLVPAFQADTSAAGRTAGAPGRQANL